jgi:antiviral helicase SKI2
VIPPKLKAGREAIEAIVEKVSAVQLKRSVGEDLAARIKFGLVEVVYEWAKGMVGVSTMHYEHVSLWRIVSRSNK